MRRIGGFTKKGGDVQKQERRQEAMLTDQQKRQAAEREEAKAVTTAEEQKNKDARDQVIAAEKQKLSTKRGASRTIATSPQGVLGAAPINKPGLTGTLSSRY